jgi:hypothetical protein
LFIDDRTDLIGSIVDEVRGLGAAAEPLAPDEVQAGDLDAADLVLLDFDLGSHEFSGEIPPLLHAHDGLAFAQVVRSYHRKSGRTGAVALLSDKLERLFGVESVHPMEHEIARLHGLEWAFDKSTTEPPPAARIVELAEATVEAAGLWHPESVAEDLKPLAAFLLLPADAAWEKHALALLGSTQPPAHSLAASSRGLSVVRWLAQRILPYPGLLVDDRHAAVLLGATPDSFTETVDSSRLGDRLSGVKYVGALERFAGRRWWRSGIQRTVIETTSGNPISSPEAVRQLNDETGAELVPTHGRSVVPLGPDLRPYAGAIGRHEAVRIRPDDWPVFAEPGYAPISLFADEDDEGIRRLRSYVDPADLPLLREATLE